MKTLFTHLLSFSLLLSVSFFTQANVLDNSIWKLKKTDTWIYNEKYNIAYNTSEDALLVVFKDHNNKYGLFFNNGNAKETGGYLYFKIDENDFKPFLNMNYGSSIIYSINNDGLISSLVHSIRRKTSISVTNSLLYSESSTFNLRNSFDAISLLKPKHPNLIILNDLALDSKRFNDIIENGIQLTNTTVGINKEYPHGYIEQSFNIDSAVMNELPENAYQDILLTYKRKDCHNSDDYIWNGDIGFHLIIKIKSTSQTFIKKMNYLCFESN
jgi:hypothetical protein